MSYIDGSLSLHSPFEKQKEKIDLNVPQLKLDIKFELPMYNGELNAEKLDNWIRQIEFYCRIQSVLKLTLRFSCLLFELEGLLSSGGKEYVKRILPQKEKLYPLGMSSLQC